MFDFRNSRVRNLASILRFALKTLKLIAGLLASRSADKLTEQERSAIVAFQLAIEALLALLPAPGEDDSPATTA